MRVNVNSWHYVLYSTLWSIWHHHEAPIFAVWELINPRRRFERGRPHPQTLCCYFWYIVMSILLLPLVLFILSLIFIVAVPIVLPIVWIGDRWRARRITRYGELAFERDPNPLVEYVRARKQRVCPIIELEGD